MRGCFVMKRLFPISLIVMLIVTIALSGCGGSSGGNNPTPTQKSDIDYSITMWGSQGTGNGQFFYPRCIAIDTTNNYIYVTDTIGNDVDGNHRVQKFDMNGNYLMQWGTRGSDNGQFKAPMGIALDGAGYVYVADFFNQRIQKFDSSGVYQKEFKSAASYFNGIAIDKVGNIYLTMPAHNVVEKFDSSGTSLWSSSDFSDPEGIAVDSINNVVYVADHNNYCIKKLNADNGSLITTWGSKGSEDGEFNYPQAVAVDADGFVYIAETNNARIQKFQPDGVFVSKWGSSGSSYGQYSIPQGIAFDTAGYLYVADTGNCRIQRFKPE
jgi:DNA-binding beta-propeller fold protein YncE